LAGARGTPGQYLRGQLANLVLLTNTTDSDDAIDCLNRCQEKLELSGMDFMDNGMVSDQCLMSVTDLLKTPKGRNNFDNAIYILRQKCKHLVTKKSLLRKLVKIFEALKFIILSGARNIAGMIQPLSPLNSGHSFPCLYVF